MGADARLREESRDPTMGFRVSFRSVEKKRGFSPNSGRVGSGRRRPRALPEAERGPGARGRAGSARSEGRVGWGGERRSRASPRTPSPLPSAALRAALDDRESMMQ